MKQIGIGAALTIINALAILLIKAIDCASSVGKNRIFLYVLFFSSNTLYQISYIVLTVALFEFIIAQSPHTMKGILIGFYYILIRFGLAGLLALIEKYALEKVPCSGMIRHIMIIIFALLSFIMFSIVACKYKLRERDEVVNVHIFAEEYYGTRENDSNTDYSVDQDASLKLTTMN